MKTKMFGNQEQCAPELQLNTQLEASGARYVLEKQIGNGRTARVYRASRTDQFGFSKQTIAVKLLNETGSIQQLRREFETLNSISSPHCAKVFGWETLKPRNGEPTSSYNLSSNLGSKIGAALILEFIDGVTLLELAKSNQFNADWVAEVVAQVQMGLRDLRTAGLHHGDLSPANIMIDRTGCVRLIDFATGPAGERSELQIEQVEVHGTPAYMAPELWLGAPTSIQSDLFALGLLRIDLLANFACLPFSEAAARARAENESLKGPFCLLSRAPEDRELESAESCAQLRSELAGAVNKRLAADFKSIEQTAQIHLFNGHSENRKKTVLRRFFNLQAAAAMALSLLISSLPVRAEAPYDKDFENFASLRVASQNWLSLEINGKDVGYAPLYIPKLRPGTHRFRWKTAGRSGEIRLKVNPGEKVVLSEAQFSRLE